MAKGQAKSTESSRFGIASHIGGRPNLEDRAHAEALQTAGGLSLLVAMVADGIGGNVQGERAAELAIDTVFRTLRASSIASPVQLPLALAEALRQANTAVFEEGRVDRSRRGMGTTAVLAAIHDNQLYLANIGDSRAYLVRDGRVEQITRDHTWAFEMQRQRLLTDAEIAKHPKRHELVRSIGYGSAVDVDLGLYVNGLLQDEREAGQNQGLLLGANDRLVLCSDGLIKERRDGAGPFVSDEEMARIAQQRAGQAAQALVQRAVDRQADDNVTAVVVEMPGGTHAAAARPALLYGALGLAALLLIGALALFLLRDGAAGVPLTPGATPQIAVAMFSEPSPTIPPPIAGQVQVLAGGGRWSAADANGALIPGEAVALPEGQRVEFVGEAGTAQLVLPDGTELFLESGAAVGLTARGAGTGIELERGRLLARGGGRPATVEGVEARAGLPGAGVMGVFLDPASLLFEAACFAGGCELAGAADGAPLQLQPGQASVVGSANRAGEPEGANYAAYAGLAPGLVPLPTATATATATETATPTPTLLPGATRRPPTATPPPAATIAPPTVAPVETEDSGGGNVPEPPDPPTEAPPTEEPPATPTSEA